MANMLGQLLGMYDSLAAEQVRSATVMAEERVRIDSLSAIVHRGNYAVAKAHKEAEILRGIMKGYITTIDSLHKLTRRPPEHPIDVRLSRCLEDTSNFSTTGMRQCAWAAMDEWDAEMNQTYAALMQALSPDVQNTLRQAQRAWLDFRDKQFALNNQVFLNEMQGTMYHVITSGNNMELVKQRAEELRTMLALLREE